MPGDLITGHGLEKSDWAKSTNRALTFDQAVRELVRDVDLRRGISSMVERTTFWRLDHLHLRLITEGKVDSVGGSNPSCSS